MLHLEKWALAQDGTKFTSIYRETLYTNLYGSHTLAYWAERDDTSKDPMRILWEESLQAMKRTSWTQQQIDTKLFSNGCGFAKIILVGGNKIPTPVPSMMLLRKTEVTFSLTKVHWQKRIGRKT